MDRPQRKVIEKKGGLIRKQRTGTKSSRLEKYLPFLDSYMSLEPAGSLSGQTVGEGFDSLNGATIRGFKAVRKISSYDRNL
jgi:hypothetical protein